MLKRILIKKCPDNRYTCEECENTIPRGNMIITANNRVFCGKHSKFVNKVNRILESTINIEEDVYRRYNPLISKRNKNNIPFLIEKSINSIEDLNFLKKEMLPLINLIRNSLTNAYEFIFISINPKNNAYALKIFLLNKKNASEEIIYPAYENDNFHIEYIDSEALFTSKNEREIHSFISDFKDLNSKFKPKIISKKYSEEELQIERRFYNMNYSSLYKILYKF